MKLFTLMLKNLWRNKVRTLLTFAAIFVLVAMLSVIYSVLTYLEDQMAEKTSNIRTVLSERYRLPSRFDKQYMDLITEGGQLNQELEEIPGFDSDKHSTWMFMAFSLDVKSRDRDQFFFSIATQPEKLTSMVDGLESLDPELPKKMIDPPQGTPNSGILIGEARLRKLGRQVGDTLEAYCRNYTDGNKQPIKMSFKIIGTIPDDTRWTDGTFIDYEYANRVLEANESEFKNRVNLGWLMIDDQESTSEVLKTLDEDSVVGQKLKSETSATAITRFLEPFKDLLFGVKYFLVPAIVGVMTLIVAASISITIRERTQEIAVLKVLGFSQRQVLTLVLGEGVLLGLFSGLISAGLILLLMNHVVGGIKIPIGFFRVFFIPANVIWIGAALGATTAFIGGLLPAWLGTSVRVSEVFSRVT